MRPKNIADDRERINRQLKQMQRREEVRAMERVRDRILAEIDAEAYLT